MRTTALTVIGTILLSACGGGGDGGSPSYLQSVGAPAQPFNIAPTTLEATSGNDTYILQMSNTLGGTATFNGQAASTSVLTQTVSKNGVTVSTEVTTTYYSTTQPEAPVPLGLSGTTNGVTWTAIVTSFTPFPATLSVGSSGPVLSASYEDASGNVIGTLTETYTVGQGDNTYVPLSIDAAGSMNGAPATENITYAIAGPGSLAPTIPVTEVQLTIDGTTLTFH